MLADQTWLWIFGMPQIVFVMVCIVSVTGIIASFWYKAQKVRAANDLKRTMIEHGMSADDIERVLAAGEDADHRPSR
jgi:hypothetical protein